MRTFSGWVYVAFVTDVFSRRIIGWQTTYRPVCTDLAAGALKMAVWQRKRAGADLTGLVHHLPPRRAVPSHPLRAGPVQLRGSRLGGVEGRLLSASPRPRRSSSLYKAELIRNQDPDRTSTPPVLATAEWVHWYGHHPATLRHRHANPCRARSRLGTRHPPPGTITTGNHRNQINQPPQNPGLDRDLRRPSYRPSSGRWSSALPCRRRCRLRPRCPRYPSSCRVWLYGCGASRWTTGPAPTLT